MPEQDALEHAADQASDALGAWDAGRMFSHAEDLAEATRNLLAELATERRARHG